MPDYDSHVHTQYSPDSDSSPAEMAREARRRGLGGLCFTDHAEFAPGEFVPSAREVNDRFAALGRLRDQYAGDMEIGIGVEIGYYPGRAADIRTFLAEWPFDFVLGTVHVARGVRYTYQGPDPGEVQTYYSAYLDSLEEMLGEIDVDSVGHFDLPKRHGPPVETDRGPAVALGPDSPYWPQVLRLLDMMVGRGVLLEINASGLRQPPGEPYPTPSILTAYRRSGGEMVTLGSDAHTPDRVGMRLDLLRRCARAAGLSRAVWFRRRRPVQWSLR